MVNSALLKHKLSEINNILKNKFIEKKYISINYVLKILQSWGKDKISLEKKSNYILVYSNGYKIAILRFTRKKIYEKLSVVEITLEKEYSQNIKKLDKDDNFSKHETKKDKNAIADFAIEISKHGLTLQSFVKVYNIYNKLDKQIQNKILYTGENDEIE